MLCSRPTQLMSSNVDLSAVPGGSASGSATRVAWWRSGRAAASGVASMPTASSAPGSVISFKPAYYNGAAGGSGARDAARVSAGVSPCTSTLPAPLLYRTEALTHFATWQRSV